MAGRSIRTSADADVSIQFRNPPAVIWNAAGKNLLPESGQTTARSTFWTERPLRFMGTMRVSGSTPEGMKALRTIAPERSSTRTPAVKPRPVIRAVVVPEFPPDAGEIPERCRSRRHRHGERTRPRCGPVFVDGTEDEVACAGSGD